VFEIDSLDVTAGADVAFAFALLRCGTPADFERDPEHRLRLTIGLHKVDDRWLPDHFDTDGAHDGTMMDRPMFSRDHQKMPRLHATSKEPPERSDSSLAWEVSAGILANRGSLRPMAKHR
jgi:hypothetical protein